MIDFASEFQCLIKKIEQTPEGWKLYPEEKDAEPICISNQVYNGKMPPFFKWPWTKLTLKYIQLWGFILEAELNGVKLFEVQEKDWPEEIKKRYLYFQKIMEEVRVKEAEEDELIKQELIKYLQLIPDNPSLEKDIQSLHVCLRAPLLGYLYRKVNSKEDNKRLTLLYKLYEIAGRLYMRHNNTSETIGGAFEVWGAMLQLYVLPLGLTYRLNGLKQEHVDIVTSNDFYQEIAREVMQQLPEIESKSLFYYIVYITHYLYMKFTLDFAHWYAGLVHIGWDNRRLSDDEEEYKRSAAKEAKLLPLYSTFILPPFTEDEFKAFLNRYSLK